MDGWFGRAAAHTPYTTMKLDRVVSLAGMLNSTLFSLYISGIIAPFSSEEGYGDLATWAIYIAVHVIVGMIVFFFHGSFSLSMKLYPLALLALLPLAAFVNSNPLYKESFIAMNFVFFSLCFFSLLGKPKKV